MGLFRKGSSPLETGSAAMHGDDFTLYSLDSSSGTSRPALRTSWLPYRLPGACQSFVDSQRLLAPETSAPAGAALNAVVSTGDRIELGCQLPPLGAGASCYEACDRPLCLSQVKPCRIAACSVALLLLSVVVVSAGPIWFLQHKAQTGGIAPREVYSLTGELPSGPSFKEHIGGFCFGFDKSATKNAVGRITVKLHRQKGSSFDVRKQSRIGRSTSNVTDAGAVLYFMTFDDQKHHWANAMSAWDENSNHSNPYVLLQHANTVDRIFSVPLVDPGTKHGTSVIEYEIQEKFTRHWQVVAQGSRMDYDIDQEDGPIRYEITAHNALSSWGKSEMDDGGKCPFPVWDYVKQKMVEFQIV